MTKKVFNEEILPRFDPQYWPMLKFGFWLGEWVFIPLITPFKPLIGMWVKWMWKKHPETLQRWIGFIVRRM